MTKPLILIFFSVASSIVGFGQDSTRISSNLCDPPILADRFPSFSNIPQYFDYVQAKKCQTTSKKTLLIYFTANYSVNSRKIEKDVLSDTSVIRLLENFIIVTLYVDDEKVGKNNSLIQEKKYNGNAQP